MTRATRGSLRSEQTLVETVGAPPLITATIGRADLAFFRRLFQRGTGLTRAVTRKPFQLPPPR